MEAPLLCQNLTECQQQMYVDIHVHMNTVCLTILHVMTTDFDLLHCRHCLVTLDTRAGCQEYLKYTLAVHNVYTDFDLFHCRRCLRTVDPRAGCQEYLKYMLAVNKIHKIFEEEAQDLYQVYNYCRRYSLKQNQA